MSWATKFVVYRLSPSGQLDEVFQTDDMKKAQYWIKYIALVGDILCRTPNHPKHSKQTQIAEYWMHKESSGDAIADPDGWKKQVDGKALAFPENQAPPAQ